MLLLARRNAVVEAVRDQSVHDIADNLTHFLGTVQ